MGRKEEESSSLSMSIVSILSDQAKCHARSILKFMEAVDKKRRTEGEKATEGDLFSLKSMNVILDYADLLLQQSVFVDANVRNPPVELAKMSDLVVGVWKERERFFHRKAVDRDMAVKSTSCNGASDDEFRRMLGTMASLYNAQAAEITETTDSIALLKFGTKHVFRGLCRYLAKLYDARSLKLKSLGGDMLKADEYVLGSLLATIGLVVKAQALEFQNLVKNTNDHEPGKPFEQPFSHERPLNGHVIEDELSSESSVFVRDQIETTSIELLSSQNLGAVEEPSLWSANIKGPSQPTIEIPTDELGMIEFTTVLVKRESNDLQIMVGIELPELKQFQEGIYLLAIGLDKICDGLATLKHDFITKDTIDIILGLKTIFEYKRNDMRKYGETLQRKGNELKYFGDIIKLDAVVSEKIGNNFDALLASGSTPQIVDMVIILRDGYKERIKLLQKAADFIARKRQYDLCKIVRRMAELLDQVVVEIDAAMPDR